MLIGLARTIDSFRGARGGSVAATFAVTLVPLVAAMGCAVDYSRAAQIRSKLQSAIDSASIGLVSRTSPGYIAAGAMTADGPIAAGIADAAKIFSANMTGQEGYALNSFTADVKKTASKVQSTTSFSADVPTTFTAIIGWKKLTVTGTSTSTASMPAYIDFYLLLDNSPSMGVGATPDDVAKMVKTHRTSALLPATTRRTATTTTSSPKRWESRPASTCFAPPRNG